MRTLIQGTLFIAFGILLAGVISMTAAPPRGEPVTLRQPPTPAPIQVYVSGGVENPGVYALPRMSRVQDAVAAAGGLAASLPGGQINLAAPLSDGDQVYIPTEEATRAVPAQSQPGPPGQVSGPQPPQEKTLNINTASARELEALPGIGPVTAQKIVDFREKNGDFESVDDLVRVSGIGPATLEKLRDQVRTGP